MRKQTVLKNIEKTIMDSSNYETNVDYTKPKYFTTFCYPYMNGKLHLGHAFTMLKADYDARFKQINGYNVLFPFGFHCTGMPIHAASMKLKKEYENGSTEVPGKVTQYDILKKSGIPETEIANFMDPYHWVKYFPNLGMEHLQKLGVMVDKRRSFVTTDINPFYDSFIRWQFNKLYEMNYLKFGTRNSIYSPSLDIQCQDHDRSKGEGVQTGEFKVCEIDNIWIPFESTFENQKLFIDKVVISSNISFNAYELDSKKVFMTQYVYDNYTSQYNKTLNLIEENVKFSEVPNKNLIIVKKHTNEYNNYLGGEVIFKDTDNSINPSNITLCLSTDLVIDRMDKVCIVKPIPQWYIDYANSEWKDKTLKYIESMKLTESIHDKLVTSVKWLKEWGVSRTFGLGTKLPMDETYVIDSLSDSTIYMAYYIVCHLIHNDIYGNESKYNPSEFNNKVWDYIFFKKWDNSISIPQNELDKMNESFKYFYPVDVRISGKDLIPNHLCMYIFNHIAIFGEENSPISINCNGWILVNGEKMAKSKGNFITVDEETEKNSLDAIRMTLAESGDGVDDANYVTKTTEETNTLKLFTFVEQIEKFNPDDYEDEYTELDSIFENIFNKVIKETIEYYESNKYKMVVSNMFHIYNNIKEKYRIFCKYFGKKQNKKVINHVIKNQLILLYPIIPHITTYLFENIMKYGIMKDINIKKEININIDEKVISDFEYIENIVSIIREKVTKLKKKNKPVNKISITSKELNDFEKKLVKDQIKNEIEFFVEKEKVIITIV